MAYHDGFKDGLLVVAPKRRQAAQEDVENDARAPHVALHAVLALEHLGRHVIGAAHHFIQHLARLDEHGEAKVGRLEDAGVARRAQQEILGLQVAVHHAQLVAVVQHAQHGAEHGRSLALAVVPSLHNAVEQLAAAAVLHHQVHRARVLVRAVHGDDVLVAGQVVHDGHLAAHVFDLLLALQLVLGDYLAREQLAGGQLHALLYGSELAPAQFFSKLVQLEDVLDGWGTRQRAIQRQRGAAPRFSER